MMRKIASALLGFVLFCTFIVWGNEKFQLVSTPVAKAEEEARTASAFPQFEKRAVLKPKEQSSLSPISIVNVIWSSDCSMLAGYNGSGQAINLWSPDGAYLRELKRVTSWGGKNLAFLGRTKQLLAAPAGREEEIEHKSFSLWNADTGELLRTVDGPAPEKSHFYNMPSHFAASPQGDIVAFTSGEVNEPLVLYETRGWTHRRSIPTAGPAEHEITTAVSFSSDGGTLAIGRTSGDILLAKLALPKAENAKALIYSSPKEEISISALAFSPDGNFLAVGSYVNHGPLITSASSDEEKIAYAPIKILRLVDLKVVASYPESLYSIHQMSWSPDGRYLAVTAEDQPLRIFIPAQPELGGTAFKFGGAVMAASFSPDGRSLAVAAGGEVSILAIKR